MAKKRRLITRRRLKWVGTAVVVAILGAIVVSFIFAPGFGRAGARSTFWIYIDKGGLAAEISRRDIDGPKTTRIMEFGIIPSRQRGAVWWYGWSDIAIPGFGRLIDVWAPLWFPLLLIAAPTAWLWRTDRRAKPWQCANCRYDLRGLEGGGNGKWGEKWGGKWGGVCPECGTRLEREL